MSDASSDDKTEDPTGRKLSNAREQGQVARSSELPAAVIVIGSLMMLLMSGGWLVSRMAQIFANGFVFDRTTIDKPLLLPAHFGDQMLSSFITVMPIMVFTVIAAIVASGVTGGTCSR